MKKYLSIGVGIVGLASVVVLDFYLFICLGTIFDTPGGGGQGDWYDATRDIESDVSIIQVLF